jgi:hypothetical protein
MEVGTTVLRDIHGLDAIPWWPLAPGWWYLVGLAGLLLLFVGIRYRLSELLRRIAMVRSGRQQAASLTGDIWLLWLGEHDNTGFAWERHGRILLTAPYMPPAMSVERKELATLIRAATRWIDASRPVEQKMDFSQRLKGLLPGTFGKSGASRV